MAGTAQSPAAASKWEQYHSKDSPPPWEFDGVTPQLEELLNEIECSVPLCGLSAVELGCGMGRNVIHLAEKGFKMAAGNELAPSAISKCCGNELKWREKFLGETSLAAAAPGDNTASAAETHPLVQQRPQCVVTWIQGDMLKKLAEPAYTGSYDIVFDCQVFHVMRVVDEQGFAQLVHSLLVPGGVYITIAGNAHEAARNPGPPVLSAAQVVSPLEAAGLQLLRLQRTHFAPTPAYGDVPPMAWLAVFSKPGVHGGSPLEQALTV